MIRVVDGLPEGVLGFRASGKLTAQAYTDVLAPALEAASAGATPPSTGCRRADTPRQAPLRDTASDAVP